MAQGLEAVSGIPPCEGARRQIGQQDPQIYPLFSPSFAPSQAPGNRKPNSRNPLNKNEILDARTPFSAEASSITMP